MAHKILYVEDNMDNMILVRRALEARGYEFIWAQNGSSGVELAESNMPDVILLDINLPDIDGYEVARRLRNSGKSTLVYVPIIAVTALAMIGDRERVLAAGFDGYISKPFEVMSIGEEISSLIAAHKARQAAVQPEGTMVTQLRTEPVEWSKIPHEIQ